MKTFLMFVAAMMCFSAYAATDVRGGAWTAEVDGDSLQVTIFARERMRDGERVHGNITSFDAPVKAFSGLSPADAAASAANVKFELRRAAGTIAFDGRFSDGTGAGQFRFAPSETFLRDMDALGYSGFTDEQLLMFAANDFSPQVIRDLRAMGYEPTQREVEEIAIFRVTAELLHDYAQLGYPNLTLREAVSFRIGRIDAAYIRSMRELGYVNVPARQLANLAILGVRPEFIRDLQSVGLTSLSAEDLNNLRVARVTAKRIEEYRKLGYTNLAAHDLAQMGILGVTPEYIRKLQALGYNGVPPEKLVKIKISGLVP